MTELPRAFLDRPIAHRALHDTGAGRPENSRAAIRAAIAGGYGIEIDLQLSSDGVAMVFHDDELDRLTGARGPISARSAEELAATPLRHGDEGIPTLAEVLELVDGRAPLQIELKDQTGRLGPETGTLEDATAAALSGYHGPVALMSFNPHSVAALASRLPDLPRGLTTCGFDALHWPQLDETTRAHLRAISDAGRTGACFISHQWRELDHPRVTELQDAGLAVLCWTVRSAEEEAQARQIARNVTFEGYAA
ncbi:glycerophosphodiester phosphodiesterase family protein [Salipiger mucosus]|uniref:Glycerophosphoryl diester phosphodiesterase n=1 Tax=Salipiger mucosus DSM 16094 TaxID=1123237 RepID=S9R4Z2_9RHOB|nr:glycerophosphodiester phosphodiesterase family protein [Salipiger mucosus]EPX86987.1 Glycerophosphoryl diester phosphodiesterase [Salipiger mucosus DSM 16094]